ncbi:hypothetical protein ABZ671_08760 [Micromonospora sp. NPDC006766]|uniref:hypothetical protein n=1 Tax=Micromonospora sp. NPDC006766 TaxID=3154778 RepID=UPI0033CB3D41
MSANGTVIDLDAVRAAVARQAERVTEGIQDIARYWDAQVADESHREVIGPLLTGTGASGVVRHHGEVVATWGDPAVPEMLFSGTKAVVATLAGVAFDRELLDPAAPALTHGRPPVPHRVAGRGDHLGAPVPADQRLDR